MKLEIGESIDKIFETHFEQKKIGGEDEEIYINEMNIRILIYYYYFHFDK